MASTYQITIERFDGGRSDDPRAQAPSQGQTIKHFDILTQPKKLRPTRSFVSDMHDGSTATGMKQYGISAIAIMPGGTDLFALGHKADGTGWKTFMKSSITAASWTALATTQAEGSTDVEPGLLMPEADALVFTADDDAYYIARTSSPVNTIFTIADYGSGPTVQNTPGLRAKDGNTYFANDHNLIKIATNLGSTSNPLDIPNTHYISSIENWGNYLALICAPRTDDPALHSMLYTYDLISADVTEACDLGPGSAKVGGNIGGVIIIVSDEFMTSSYGNDHGKLVIRGWSGGNEATILKEVRAMATGGSLISSKYVKNGQLHFWAKIPTNLAGNTFEEGIYAFGRKRSGDPWAFSMPVDTSQITNGSGVQYFSGIGNFFYLMHSGDGSISRTDDTETYSYTSVYESQIFPRDYEAAFTAVELTCDALPSAGSITVKYRVNGATSWTTIGTYDTDDGTYVLWTKPASDEFVKHHEVEFRVESTGGAVPVRLRAKYQTLSSAAEE